MKGSQWALAKVHASHQDFFDDEGETLARDLLFRCPKRRCHMSAGTDAGAAKRDVALNALTLNSPSDPVPVMT